MDNVKHRLLQYAKLQNIAMMEFYKKTSISQSNFSGVGAESALSTDKIIHILITFSDINPDWLLLGKGEMLRQNNQNATDAAVNHEKFYRQYIADKEKIIEDLTRENEHLRIENEQMKASCNTGIVVQHDGGGNNYSINTDMQQLVMSQQKTIQNLTEQNAALTNIIANKI